MIANVVDMMTPILGQFAADAAISPESSAL
jgi:hypothetical protein